MKTMMSLVMVSVAVFSVGCTAQVLELTQDTSENDGVNNPANPADTNAVYPTTPDVTTSAPKSQPKSVTTTCLDDAGAPLPTGTECKDNLEVTGECQMWTTTDTCGNPHNAPKCVVDQCLSDAGNYEPLGTPCFTATGMNGTCQTWTTTGPDGSPQQSEMCVK